MFVLVGKTLHITLLMLRQQMVLPEKYAAVSLDKNSLMAPLEYD